MSNVYQVQDQAAKTLIYNLQQDIKKLTDRLDEMERIYRPPQTNKIHVRGGDRSLETAFINKRHNIPD